MKRLIILCRYRRRRNLWTDKEEGRKYTWVTFFSKRMQNYFRLISCTVSKAETYTGYVTWSGMSQKPSHTICNIQSALFIAGILAVERTTSVFVFLSCRAQSYSDSVNNMKARHFALHWNRLMFSVQPHPTSFRPIKINLPSTLVSTKGSLFLKFTEQNVTIYHVTLACYMHHLFHFKPRFMGCTSQMKCIVFWNVKACSVVDKFQHIAETDALRYEKGNV
jgi:hypothetical protein